MPIVNVENKRITFPDSMSRDEIKAALDKQFGQKKPEYNSAVQGVRQVGQGLSFGLADEVGGALAALAGSMQTGESFNDAYDKIQADLKSKRGAFQEDNPVLAPALEVAGGLATGGLGGAKVLGSQAVRNAPGIARAGALLGTGAAEGAIYGAGTADAGERAQGAAEGGALGAVTAGLGAPIVNALGRVGGATANRLANMAASSPKGDAKRVLRETAEATGLTPDEAVKRMRELGPDAVIADLDEGMRLVARAGSNRMGPMRERADDFVMQRDRQQNDRLLSTIEAAAGSSKSFGDTQKNIVRQRKEQSAPLYDLARRQGIELTPDLRDIVKNPRIQGAANKLASLQGRPPLKAPTRTIVEPPSKFQRQGTTRTVRDESATIFDDMTPQDRFDYLKYAKEGLSDMIGQAQRQGKKNEVRLLTQQKNALLDAMGRQNPEYIRANSIFSSASELQDALVNGRKLMSSKTDVDEVADLMQGMSKTEQDMFRLGAVKSVADKLDSMGLNRDINAVIGTGAPNAVRRKIELVMGDDAPEFLRRAGVEEEFTKTKRAVTGNSTTELQKQIGESFDQMIDPGFLNDIANSNRSNIVGNVIKVLSARKPTPEIVEQLGEMMFKQGYTDRQIRNILGGNGVKRALGDDYDRIIAPFVSGAAPITGAISSNQNI